MHESNIKHAFQQLLFEANLLLKEEGILENKNRFFDFAPLLILRRLSEYRDTTNLRRRMRLKSVCHWQHFSKHEPAKMLQALNQVILPNLVRIYNLHTQFFQKKSSIKNPETLKKLAARLSLLDLSKLDSDILAIIHIPLSPLYVQRKIVRLFNSQDIKKVSYLKQIQKISEFKNKTIQALIDKYQGYRGTSI